MKNLPHYLDALTAEQNNALRGIRRGLEKEALRITPNGKLAQTQHPASLGAALTNPHITTDFSEALLEFITPPCESIANMLQWMDEIHRFACQQLERQGELLWMASMPCVIDDALIPIAEYGKSNTARMKHTYRLGLSHRYGRSMQAIAGIHYNFSLPDDFWLCLQKIDGDTKNISDYKTEKYFSLIRNFRRYFWLMLYLFGAAPAVCPTFVKTREHSLDSLDEHSLYFRFATSLRMGELGYQSTAQDSLTINYNSLSGYINSLLSALTTPHADYEKIGVRENGLYKQLNTNILQIENEFYSAIRPKRTTLRGETPIRALRDRGVEYIEVRSVDINPFNAIGIDSTQSHFIETFLLFCLLEESPPTNAHEYKDIADNQRQVVNFGRDPTLDILCHGEKVNLRACAKSLLEKIQCVAPLLDQAMQTSNYGESVASQFIKLSNDNETPSAKVLNSMQDNGMSFFKMAYRQSQQHQEGFLTRALPVQRQTFFEQLAKQSFIDQSIIEESDDITFEQYLAHYFQQYTE